MGRVRLCVWPSQVSELSWVSGCFRKSGFRYVVDCFTVQVLQIEVKSYVKANSHCVQLKINHERENI